MSDLSKLINDMLEQGITTGAEMIFAESSYKFINTAEALADTIHASRELVIVSTQMFAVRTSYFHHFGTFFDVRWKLLLDERYKTLSSSFPSWCNIFR